MSPPSSPPAPKQQQQRTAPLHLASPPSSPHSGGADDLLQTGFITHSAEAIPPAVRRTSSQQDVNEDDDLDPSTEVEGLQMRPIRHISQSQSHLTSPHPNTHTINITPPTSRPDSRTSNRVRLNSQPVNMGRGEMMRGGREEEKVRDNGSGFGSGKGAREEMRDVEVNGVGHVQEKHKEQRGQRLDTTPSPLSSTSSPHTTTTTTTTATTNTANPEKPSAPSNTTPAAKPPTTLDKLKIKLNELEKHRLANWIRPAVTNFEAMKPVIRCAVAAWIGLLFILIHPVEAVLGQAAFFTLVVAFIAPPILPFTQSLEQLFFVVLFPSLAWVWVVIAGLCMNAARKGNYSQAFLEENQRQYGGLEATNPQQFNRRLIFEGSYIEAGPAIIGSAFLGIGTAFFTWLKIHTQPSPFTFALVLSCILMDVSLTIMHLFPYSYLDSGLLFMLPIGVQIGVAVLASCIILPQSVSSSFITKLNGVLSPLATSGKDLEHLFQQVQETCSKPDVHPLHRYESHPGTTDPDQDNLEQLERMKGWVKLGMGIKGKLTSSAAGLGPLKGQESYLTKEFSYSRFSGADIQSLFPLVQTLQLRCGGIAFYFDVLFAAINRSHLDSSAYNIAKNKGMSRPASRIASRAGSLADEGNVPLHRGVGVEVDDRRKSITPVSSHQNLTALDADEASHNDYTNKSHKSRKKSHNPFDWYHHAHQSFHKTFNSGHHSNSHISLFEHLKRSQEPVGVFESIKYLEVEHAQAGDADVMEAEFQLLSAAAQPLLQSVNKGLENAQSWLNAAKKDRSFARALLPIGPAKKKVMNAELEENHTKVRIELQKVLEEFRTSDRLKVISPYRHLLDPNQPADENIDYRKIQHRALFWSFLFSYHVMEFSAALIELLLRQEVLAKERKKDSFWMPKLPFSFIYFKKKAKVDDDDHDLGLHEDADPSQNIASHHDDDLGLGRAKRRDPDSQPFETPILNSLKYVDRALLFMQSTEFLFAVKSGLLTVLVSLPAFLPSSAGFFYYNRDKSPCSDRSDLVLTSSPSLIDDDTPMDELTHRSQVVIMAQLTLSLTSGDTANAWLQRLQASFWGCLLGMVAWYISSGSGHGNPYGIGAVCAVLFIPVMTIRVHFPGSPLPAILFSVSFALVVGYSYINATLIQATNATWGWDVTWRRFVSVIIGITAAWIFAMLPPVISGKRQIRLSYARTISRLGNLLCDILSEMHDPHYIEALPEDCEVRNTVLAMKRSLTKLGARHETIRFEVSLKGVWPEKRYAALQDVCVDLVALMSQLHHVTRDLPYKWRRAVLRRTRLSDSQFIGDLLAVISMCASALKAGTPLPQVTPGPLVERMLSKYYGLEVAAGSWDEDHSLPKHVTADVLESEEYMKYAISTTCIFAITRRFDRLLLVIKTIVGEEFHLDHLDMAEKYS